jgi:hypothetical protein
MTQITANHIFIFAIIFSTSHELNGLPHNLEARFLFEKILKRQAQTIALKKFLIKAKKNLVV